MKARNAAARSIIGIPLALYGYTLQKTWGAVEGVIGTYPTLFQSSLITVGGALISVVLAIASRKLGNTSGRRKLFVFGMALQILAALLDMFIVLTEQQDAIGFIAASFILKSAGTLVISALWIELYAILNPVRSGFLCAASTALSALVLYIVEQASGAHLLALRLALTVFSGMFYWMAWRDVQAEHATVDSRETRFAFPAKGMAFVAAYSLAYGMATYLLQVRNTNYAAVIPAVIVMALLLRNARSFDSSSLSRFALPLMLGGFTLASFASMELDALSSLMLDTGFSSMELILLLMVCGWSYSTGMSPIWMFGVLTASQFLGNFTGSFLASQLHAHEGTPEFFALEIFAIVIVAAISPMLASEKSLASFWKGAAAGNDMAASSDKLKMRVDELTAKYGLTARESEVLLLAAQGKTNAAIAADMVLSEGTIKTHLHHVYRKFGISTRAELMRLVSK